MKFSRHAWIALVASIVLSAGCGTSTPPAPATQTPAPAPTSGYKLIKTVPFGAAPGVGATREYFDYVVVDSADHRVYLMHGTECIVVDTDTDEKIGTVTGPWKRAHGVAVVPDLNRGFITDGDAGLIYMFDLKTLKVVKTIKGQDDADWIMYDPASKLVFAFNGDSKSSTVIDPAKGVVVKTIPLGGGPEQAVSDGAGMIYDNLATTNEIVAINTKTLAITARYPVAPAGEPTSIAMDRKTRRLFVGGRDPKLLEMMDADTGKVIGSGFPIGARTDAIAFDPDTDTVAVATRVGELHIFHEDSPDKLSLVETIKDDWGAKTMGLDPATHNLYLTTSDWGPTPAPTAKDPDPQPTAKAGTFRLLIYGK
ncbi:MAG: YncE family protein [Candidatus Acidiferrales bacterium]